MSGDPFLWPSAMLPHALSDGQPLPSPWEVDQAIAYEVAAQAEGIDPTWRGTVYLLHFASPIQHAQHYLGWTTLALDKRLAVHRSGKGARLLQVANQRGVEWFLVRSWPNQPQAIERRLKEGFHGSRLCPVCDPAAYQHGEWGCAS